MPEQDNLQEYREILRQTKQELQRTIVGMEEVIDQVLIALMANGHVLLEGVPGLGKSLLVQTLGRLFDVKHTRIQFTPDLMPADITGTNIVMEDQQGQRFFQFQPGPLFANIVLADEINRATPKTQSALLEAMQERSVSIGGVTRVLEPPFFVMATQNPIEMEGTYPLPEAQVDRFFFKLNIDYPSYTELNTILKRTTGETQHTPSKVLLKEQFLDIQRMVRRVPMADEVMAYCARLVLASHPQESDVVEPVTKYVRYGASPRGAQALVLAAKAWAFLSGRYSVSYDDVKAMALPALRHRILLNLEGEATGQDVDDILRLILEEVSTES